MDTKAKRGQAMLELAFGMFAVALVVSALCGFAIYIAKSLEMQNSLRVKTASQRDSLEVSDFASEYVFGRKTLIISHQVEMPSKNILK